MTYIVTHLGFFGFWATITFAVAIVAEVCRWLQIRALHRDYPALMAKSLRRHS